MSVVGSHPDDLRPRQSRAVVVQGGRDGSWGKWRVGVCGEGVGSGATVPGHEAGETEPVRRVVHLDSQAHCPTPFADPGPRTDLRGDQVASIHVAAAMGRRAYRARPARGCVVHPIDPSSRNPSSQSRRSTGRRLSVSVASPIRSREDGGTHGATQRGTRNRHQDHVQRLTSPSDINDIRQGRRWAVARGWSLHGQMRCQTRPNC